MGGIVSGFMGASAASDAANAQLQAAQTAAQTQKYMFDKMYNLELPFAVSGQEAQRQLDYWLGLPDPGMTATGVSGGAAATPGTNLLSGGGYTGGMGGWEAVRQASIAGKQPKTTTAPLAPQQFQGSFGEYARPFTMNELQLDPGYQFELQTALDSIKAQAAAAGKFGSGTMGTALEQMAYNIANQGYTSAYNRKNDIWNKFATMAGAGMGQSQAIGTLGMNTANALGNIYMGGAQNASMYNYLGAQNLGRAVSGLGQGVGAYYGNQQQGNLLTQIMNQAFGPYGAGGGYYDASGALGAYGGGLGYTPNLPDFSAYAPSYGVAW